MRIIFNFVVTLVLGISQVYLSYLWKLQLLKITRCKTTEEVLRTYQLKHCNGNNKDDDSSLKNGSNKKTKPLFGKEINNNFACLQTKLLPFFFYKHFLLIHYFILNFSFQMFILHQFLIFVCIHVSMFVYHKCFHLSPSMHLFSFGLFEFKNECLRLNSSKPQNRQEHLALVALLQLKVSKICLSIAVKPSTTSIKYIRDVQKVRSGQVMS